MNPYPRNVPVRLAEIFEQNGSNVRALEKLLSVNRYYIYQLLKKGIEPTDKTKKGRKARVAMFLPERKERKKREYPDYILEWLRLPKEERHHVIQVYIKWKKEQQHDTVDKSSGGRYSPN